MFSIRIVAHLVIPLTFEACVGAQFPSMQEQADLKSLQPS